MDRIHSIFAYRFINIFFVGLDDSWKINEHFRNQIIYKIENWQNTKLSPRLLQCEDLKKQNLKKIIAVYLTSAIKDHHRVWFAKTKNTSAILL